MSPKRRIASTPDQHGPGSFWKLDMGGYLTLNRGLPAASSGPCPRTPGPDGQVATPALRTSEDRKTPGGGTRSWGTPPRPATRLAIQSIGDSTWLCVAAEKPHSGRLVPIEMSIRASGTTLAQTANAGAIRFPAGRHLRSAPERLLQRVLLRSLRHLRQIRWRHPHRSKRRHAPATAHVHQRRSQHRSRERGHRTQKWPA